MTARAATHAGVFYPASPAALRCAMAAARHRASPCPPDPVAVVVPHAAWTYCNPVIASGLCGAAPDVDHVIHIGPSHYHDMASVSASGATAFDTPLGPVPVSAPRHGGIETDARAHAPEHALEVHLPWIRERWPKASYVPMLVGAQDNAGIADLLEADFLASPKSLIVVSSDLSHGLSPRAARARDRETLRQVEALDASLDPSQACGAVAVNGLLTLAQRRGWRAIALHRRDTIEGSGGMNLESVVGYAAMAFYGT